VHSPHFLSLSFSSPPPRGSLEYGTVGYTPGQVIGGRWKPLHHFMAQHLYRDVVTICGVDGSCFTKNDDALSTFDGSVSLGLLSVVSGKTAALKSVPISLPRGGGAFSYFCLGSGDISSSCQPVSAVLTGAGCQSDGSDCILIATTSTSGGDVVDDNWGLLNTPGAVLKRVPDRANVSATVLDTPPGPGGSVSIRVKSDGFALYVTLTSLAQGRFEPNAFIIPAAGEQVVAFVPFEGFDVATLASTLRVQHVAMYI
jgi:beta-mannosidase